MCTPVFCQRHCQGFASPFASHPPIQERIKKFCAMGRKISGFACGDGRKNGDNDGAASAFSAGADVGMASAVTASGGGQPPDLFNALFGGDGSNIPPAISPAAISSAKISYANYRLRLDRRRKIPIRRGRCYIPYCLPAKMTVVVRCSWRNCVNLPTPVFMRWYCACSRILSVCHAPLAVFGAP